MVGAANRLRSFCGQGGPQTVRFRVLGGGVPGVGQTGGQAPASIGQPAGAEDATASGFVVASREASCQTQTGLGHGGLAWTRERLILAQKRRQGDSLAGSPVVATRLARSSTIAEREARTARTLFECGDADGACDRAYYAIFGAVRAALLAAGHDADKTRPGALNTFSDRLMKSF